MGTIILILLAGVIIWTLWRLATIRRRRLPLDYFSQFDEDFKVKNEDSKITKLQDTEHEIEDEKTTSKKD